MVNKKLVEYIENQIFPIYEKNDKAHDINHIQYVIKRSLAFAQRVPNINYDMVYTIAAYHDIGHYIDAKNHEKVSSEMLLLDEHLKEYFTEEERITMAEAVYDHRASLKDSPRSIYGKIVSSADRNTIVEGPLKRTYEYRKKHKPTTSIDEIIEDSRKHIIEKFGKEGYAKEKMYFQDPDYERFLISISQLAEDKDEFAKIYKKVNKIS